MDPREAAGRWRNTWERAWPAKDVEAIVALYARDAVYRSHPLREPAPSPRDYLESVFPEEEQIECRFGEPVAAGDRAAVEWWASYVENARLVTLCGATVLRFDAAGLVTEHVDYWVQEPGWVATFAGWGAGEGRSSEG